MEFRETRDISILRHARAITKNSDDYSLLQYKIPEGTGAPRLPQILDYVQSWHDQGWVTILRHFIPDGLFYRYH